MGAEDRARASRSGGRDEHRVAARSKSIYTAGSKGFSGIPA